MGINSLILSLFNPRNKSFLATITLVLFMCINPMHSMAFDLSAYAPKSVLSSGNWAKIKVTENGVQRITQSDLSKWGFRDISKVRIFGYGGAPISETLAGNTYIDDLPQLPISRDGNSILFYGKNHESVVKYYTDGMQYRQVQHPYAEAGYYFITDGEFPDLLMETTATPVGEDGNVTSFTEILFHEKEQYSPGMTGRLLLGEDFKYTSTQSFKFDMIDIVPKSQVSVLTTFGAKIINGSGKLSFTQNGANIASTTKDNIRAVASTTYDHVNILETVKNFTTSERSLSYSVALTYTGSLTTARLDHITVNYTRALKLNNKKLFFRGDASHSENVAYVVSDASAESQVWDVTNSVKPFKVKSETANSTIKFSPTGGGREFIVFDPTTSFGTPTLATKVNNQNLHAEATPNMVIVSPKEFLNEAERVAELHRTIDKMKVLVIDQDMIYNEFSSGTPDGMAYRKMLKMFYDRGKTGDESQRLGYLLLFGRGSYDNRQITDKVRKSSYPKLLTWQTEIGDDETDSYTSDDFFAFLADGSGGNIANDKIDIAVGRMVVKDLKEARAAVDKLYKYVTKPDYGSWKNHLLMIADDEDNAAHMSQTELCITAAKNNGGKQYSYDRVYLDAFAAVNEGSKRGYPDARTKMFQKMNEGALWINYVGHANPVSWSHHGLLTMTDINEKLFYNHQPLLYTATCEFTRWDSDDVSGGELMFLNSRGGAIAVMSASRVVYISSNGVLNEYVSKYIFKKDQQGNYPRIGDILRNGKNAYSGANTNKLRYQLIGDPAMRLAYPTRNIALETINGVAVNGGDEQSTIKARQNVVITGSVYDDAGNKDTKFQGSVMPTLYDAEVSVETNGHGEGGTKYVYQDRSNRLYIGLDSIKNGEFKINFNMPSEIANNFSPAMFSFYAHSKDGIEANGANENLYAYGYDETVERDTVGPTIDAIYLNSTAFKNGDNVNESPMLTATFKDASGINVSSSGIGHQLSVLLDGTDLRTDVVQYYTPSVGVNGGTINYPLTNLDKGNHTLRFKVWDTFNNSSEKEISFFVVPGLAPVIYDVYTTSNPASEQAEFLLKHNRPDAQITVTITVSDIAGRVVWTATEKGKSDFFTSFPIVWNLCDGSGKRVNRGIYVYRATITTDGVQEATASKKLAVTE